MAAVARVTLTGPWTKVASLLHPTGASARIKREIGNATSANGRLAVKAIRKVIQGGMSPANAPLTVLIKGSSKPIAGVSGELFKAIACEKINAYTAEVGVRKGDPEANSAIVAHEGARIKVTGKMRAMFARLADVSDGSSPASILTGRAAELWRQRPGGWHALKQGTTHIKVPGRPFIQKALDDDTVRQKMGHNWLAAWAAGLNNTRFKAVT